MLLVTAAKPWPDRHDTITSVTGRPVVAMVGGGQLARMTHQAAIALGQSLRVLAVSPDDPAAQVSPDVVIGSHADLEALRRAAAGAEALTFDHEHVPTDLLHTLVADGVSVLPAPETLVYAQDKLAMRRRLADLGAPIPRFAEVRTVDDVDAFAAQVGGPVVIKTVRGGYDGRGVVLADDLAAAREAVGRYLADGVSVLLEERVAMRRELAALVARSPFGQGAAWPVVETVQRQGICVAVLAPAPGLSDELAAEAEELGLRIAEQLGVVGVLAVELFETSADGLLVNELAMRPHNSGHWTMNGAVTSQFEQHLRAVLDWPLGDTELVAPHAVMINVFGGLTDDQIAQALGHQPSAKVHAYGKSPRPGRKAGHVTAMGDDLDDAAYRARAAAAHFDA